MPVSIGNIKYRKYKATFPVAPPSAPPRTPPVFPCATGYPPPAAPAAGQRWMQQAGRRPAPPRRGLGTERLRGCGGGEESGRAARKDWCKRTTGSKDEHGEGSCPRAATIRTGGAGMTADSHASPPTLALTQHSCHQGQ